MCKHLVGRCFSNAMDAIRREVYRCGSWMARRPRGRVRFLTSGQLESMGASSQTLFPPTQRFPQSQQVHPALQGFPHLKAKVLPQGGNSRWTKTQFSASAGRRAHACSPGLRTRTLWTSLCPAARACRSLHPCPFVPRAFGDSPFGLLTIVTDVLGTVSAL